MPALPALERFWGRSRSARVCAAGRPSCQEFTFSCSCKPIFFSKGSLGAHSRPKTTALARCNFVGSLLLETLVLADQILYARLREPNPSGWRHFVPSGARLTRSGLLLRRTSFGLQCSTARANVIAFSLRNNVCGQASKHDLHCIRQKKPEDAHVR